MHNVRACLFVHVHYNTCKTCVQDPKPPSVNADTFKPTKTVPMYMYNVHIHNAYIHNVHILYVYIHSTH